MKKFIHPLIIEKRGWKKYSKKNNELWYTGSINYNLIKTIEKKLNFIKKSSFSSLLLTIAEKIDGSFALIGVIDNINFAVVDRIKSIPIFLAEKNQTFQFSNHAPALSSTLKPNEYNYKESLSLAMSGYTIGRNSIIKNIRQLLAGECSVIVHGKCQFINYYNFIEKNNVKDKKHCSIESLSKELETTTLDIFKSLIEKSDGRQICVPLSAGYDSRLIASVLYKLKAKNVICYCYGRKNNFEAKTSEAVAKQLNFPWFFIPISNASTKKNFRSELYLDYINYADTLSSFPYVQDLFVVNQLKKANIVNENSLIVNGNTGDFISGGHIPNMKKISALQDKPFVKRIDAILNIIIEKHFSLWTTYYSKSETNIIKKELLNSLPLKKLSLRHTNDYKIIEYLEFINRQTKYVVQGQRVYDFHEISWELPLWDKKYLEFWNSVPLSLKYNQNLYKYMLKENNWGNVWQNYKVNKIYVSPPSIRLLRNIAKSFFVMRKRKIWHDFDKKYFAYWSEIIPHYPAISYLDVISDKRGARNSISWNTERYLCNKGLNINGKSIQ